ncbi:MAG: cell division protein FtsN [Sodalis sp. Psp]|nr:cell division protein FtsN [Sodalis sp. Psp]MCR3757156.1 cell division protein FtsN [Sodalis sp. Ppy]
MVAVLIMFISGLYFISHNKSEETVIVPNRGKGTGSGLPSKPEERWRYIKELENRQVSVQIPTGSTISKELNSPVQLTNEQRHLLKHMQEDMLPKPTHLNKVPYNNQNKFPVADAIQQWVNTQASLSQQLAQPVQRHAETDTAQKVPEEKPPLWLVQCGSFKEMDQAESVRAQLAFAGIEGRVISSDGWNRVLLGPYPTRAIVDKILQSIYSTGVVSNCTLTATKGRG